MTQQTMTGPRRSPAPGGLDRALAAGRARLRRRRVAQSAACVSAAVAVAAALAGHAVPNAADRLEPATVPTAAGVAASSPPVTAPPTSLPTVVPSNAALPSGLPVILPSPGASEPPSPEPTEAASPTQAAPRRWVGTGPRNADGSPAVRVSTSNDPAACAQPPFSESVARTGFCTFATGERALVAGTAADYSYTLCRAAQSDKTLTYRTSYETGFAVSDPDKGTGELLWIWGDPDTFPANQHTITFHGGDCRTWTVTWSGQDSAGWALPDGQYELLGSAMPVEWVDEDHDEPMPPPASVFVTVAS